MMTNDLMLGSVYIVMAMTLVLGALISRREPAAKLFTMALAWVVIFAAGFVLFTFRDNLGWVAQRLKAEAVWVNAKLNGLDVKFLVDSGATTTTIDRGTARDAGVEVSSRRDQFVRTGNGVIRVASGRADELTVGGITRHGVALEIADNDDLNVLGMNYLSTLSRWSVEGRWLVLIS